LHRGASPHAGTLPLYVRPQRRWAARYVWSRRSAGREACVSRRRLLKPGYQQARRLARELGHAGVPELQFGVACSTSARYQEVPNPRERCILAAADSLASDMGRSHLAGRLPKRCRRWRSGYCCRTARVYTHAFRTMFIQSPLLDVASDVAQKTSQTCAHRVHR
jgi:hypothetical protein